jgi:hypothetical protein
MTTPTLELPVQLTPRPFVCLTRGHYSEQFAQQALVRMLRIYYLAARRSRANRGKR